MVEVIVVGGTFPAAMLVLRQKVAEAREAGSQTMWLSPYGALVDEVLYSAMSGGSQRDADRLRGKQDVRFVVVKSEHICREVWDVMHLVGKVEEGDDVDD